MRQAALELVDARAVHEHPSRGGATLAGGADGAEHDGRHREIEVGGFVDDDRVVAAQFEQALAQPARDTFGHTAAHGR